MEKPVDLAELARKLVNPERYGHPLVQAAAVLNLPLQEVAHVYKMPLPERRNGLAGSGA